MMTFKQYVIEIFNPKITEKYNYPLTNSQVEMELSNARYEYNIYIQEERDKKLNSIL